MRIYPNWHDKTNRFSYSLSLSSICYSIFQLQQNAYCVHVQWLKYSSIIYHSPKKKSNRSSVMMCIVWKDLASRYKELAAYYDLESSAESQSSPS